ncbi:MAG TPA: rRNA maturation RNase YbeY, partial [Flavobacterium sp.]|nr:rRNA maturation RNase YbeY [Flavobacterium sp.]
ILMSITFHFLHPVQLLKRKKIKVLVQRLFSNEKKLLNNLDIIFCADEYLLDMNQKYLSHDYYTDIITFDLGDGDSVAGEIYISAETAKSNSQFYNVLLFNELVRLIIHGSLHLVGYGDKNKKDKVIMSAKENEYLSLFETL